MSTVGRDYLGMSSLQQHSEHRLLVGEHTATELWAETVDVHTAIAKWTEITAW